MIQYPALLHGEEGAYGMVFPDIPRVGAMGHAVDEALVAGFHIIGSSDVRFIEGTIAL